MRLHLRRPRRRRLLDVDALRSCPGPSNDRNQREPLTSRVRAAHRPLVEIARRPAARRRREAPGQHLVTVRSESVLTDGVKKFLASEPAAPGHINGVEVHTLALFMINDSLVNAQPMWAEANPVEEDVDKTDRYVQPRLLSQLSTPSAGLSMPEAAVSALQHNAVHR